MMQWWLGDADLASVAIRPPWKSCRWTSAASWRKLWPKSAPAASWGRPPRDVDATLDVPIGERPGTVIGPYKLIEPIGDGGMGTVWMAQQTAAG